MSRRVRADARAKSDRPSTARSPPCAAASRAVVNVLVDRVASGDRADPLVQMISFNRLRFGGV